jgi:hypothetical protein
MMEWLEANWATIVVPVLVVIIGLLQARGKITENAGKRMIRLLQLSRFAGGDSGSGANLIIGALRNNEAKDRPEVTEKIFDMVQDVKGRTEKRERPLKRFGKLIGRAILGVGLRRLP